MDKAKTLKYLLAGRNAFLTGPAGSGKTYLLNEFIDTLRRSGKKVAVTASTGIAATHLNGTTIHSWSGIGIADSLSAYALDAIVQKQYLHTRFNSTDVLIIDEISMFDAARLDAVDTVLRAVRNTDVPFGGIQVVISGDFFQLPPITRGNVPVRYAFQAKVWERMSDLVICYLDFVYRQSDDPLLSVLQEIRQGDVSETTVDLLKDRLEAVMPDSLTPTRLYSHNIDVDAINLEELKKLTGEQRIFHMTSTGKKDSVKLLKKYCMAPEELSLKIGAAVMCIKNNPKAGYINGTLGTVVEFGYESVVIQTADGKNVTVQPDNWAIEQDGKVLAQISQLPLRLAWAITVHKSQGMTLDEVEVDLSKSFAPGMGYVALSRVRTLNGLFLRGINQRALQVDPRVQEQDAIFLKLSHWFDTN